LALQSIGFHQNLSDFVLLPALFPKLIDFASN
jgi:hypothetical protein